MGRGQLVLRQRENPALCSHLQSIGQEFILPGRERGSSDSSVNAWLLEREISSSHKLEQMASSPTFFVFLFFLTSRIFSLDFHFHCFKSPNVHKYESISQSPTAWLTSTRVLTMPDHRVPSKVRIIGRLWILLCPGRFQATSGTAQLRLLVICSVSFHSQKYLMEMLGHVVTRHNTLMAPVYSV